MRFFFDFESSMTRRARARRRAREQRASRRPGRATPTPNSEP
tara:strand:+ start:1916 stop:2041 length:126 start_codon:yes stop_codon:yes gene_type:complete